MPRRNLIKVTKDRHLKLAAFLAVTACVLLCISASVGRGVPVYREKPDAVPIALELPFCADGQFVMRNEAGRYTLLYDTSARQAAWVAYLLTRKEVEQNGVARKNNFRMDTSIMARGWPAAKNSDYKGSGYDKGHLLPSADRDDYRQENAATFFMSNISPQKPSLNREIWRLLEEQVRKWAALHDSLYIVTGGKLSGDMPRIGSGVAVPPAFFKAVLARGSQGRYYSIGFLIPNSDKITSSFMDYSMTINELEDVSGYDFFYRLPDDVEDDAERTIDRSFWE